MWCNFVCSGKNNQNINYIIVASLKINQAVITIFNAIYTIVLTIFTCSTPLCTSVTLTNRSKLQEIMNIVHSSAISCYELVQVGVSCMRFFCPETHTATKAIFKLVQVACD
jgi:hypothetical protein